MISLVSAAILLVRIENGPSQGLNFQKPETKFSGIQPHRWCLDPGPSPQAAVRTRVSRALVLTGDWPGAWAAFGRHVTPHLKGDSFTRNKMMDRRLWGQGGGNKEAVQHITYNKSCKLMLA